MKWTHQNISYLKSIVRLASSLLAVVYPLSAGLVILAVGYGLAEVIGVWEEKGQP